MRGCKTRGTQVFGIGIVSRRGSSLRFTHSEHLPKQQRSPKYQRGALSKCRYCQVDSSSERLFGLLSLSVRRRRAIPRDVHRPIVHPVTDSRPSRIRVNKHSFDRRGMPFSNTCPNVQQSQSDHSGARVTAVLARSVIAFVGIEIPGHRASAYQRTA